jgi:hypothetical protein
VSCPSALQLDRWLTEVNPALATHVDGCTRCAKRLAALRDERARFEASARPRAFADAVLARRPRRRRWWWFAPVLATACALLFWMRSREPEITFKGGPQALLYVEHQGVVAPHDAGRRYQAGDRVQVVALTSQPAYVAVVDVEAGGKESVLYASDAPLPAGRNRLPLSFQLDAYPGDERLVVLFGTRLVDDPQGRVRRGEGQSFALRR